MQNALGRTVCWIVLFSVLFINSFAHAQSGSQTAKLPTTALGPLHGLGQWAPSERKDKDATGVPQVASPGLGKSQRAAFFTMKGSEAQGNTSSQRVFGPLRSDRIVVELTVQPSSESRNLGIAVRGGGAAAAYLRLGKKKGICEYYDDKNTFREVGTFKANEDNRIRIECNTRKQTIRAWINGVGGQAYPFHDKTPYVDRVDLFLAYGPGTPEFALVDNIVVRDGEGNVIFSEDFERYFPSKPIANPIPPLAIPKMLADADGVYRPSEEVPVFCPVELELHAQKPSQNPYIDGPEVTCTFTGVSDRAVGKKISVAGFWDGNDSWRIRFAPTASGKWQLKTTSSDEGLNGKTGELTARVATQQETEANSLRRGFLETSGRVFRLSDGSQFMPVGDSQFSFTEEFYDEEWRAWVDVLHARGLNSFLGMVWLGRYTRAGVSPFRNYDPASDQLSVEFFQRLDRWIAYANDRGIVMGLGLGGFPLDSQLWWVRFQTRDREDRYFKYIVSRYAAFNVRWLMYGEVNETNPPWRVKWDDEVRYKAELVKKADPYHHLIGSHHNSADLRTIDSPYIDYLDYQDGGHENDGANLPIRARKWANESRGKPVWSEEFWYSAPYYVKKNKFGNEAGTRCLHLNFLSGLAFPTLGSLMRAHSTYEGFPPSEATEANVPLKQYLLENDESLKRFGAFKSFYSELPLDKWECTEFEPANKVWTARFGEHFVTYLAPGKTKTIDLSGRPGRYKGTALLIQTDGLVDLGEFSGGGSVSLALPGGKADEAVVKLIRQPDKE